MNQLHYISHERLNPLAAKAAVRWNMALKREVFVPGTGVNMVIVMIGAVDRTIDPIRVAQFDRRTRAITLAADVTWSITFWQRFFGLGDQDALAALLHEFGHALGLPHSDIYSDVMHPELGSTVISADEAARARAFLRL